MTRLVGCEARPDLNVLGLEIRKPLAQKNQEEAVAVPNLGFISCNANVDLSRIREGVNKHSKVERVCIQVTSDAIVVALRCSVAHVMTL